MESKYVIFVDIHEVDMDVDEDLPEPVVARRDAGAYDDLADAMGVVARMFDAVPDVVDEVAASYIRARDPGPTRAAPWADLEAQIVRNVVQLNTGGSGGNNVLIVSAGDAYVQLLSARGSRNAICEAVSNDFLPVDERLSDEKIEVLRRHGFADPGAANGVAGKPGRTSPNFSQVVDLTDPMSGGRIGRLVREVLEDVYGCTPASVVTIALTLEAWRASTSTTRNRDNEA